MSESNVFNQGDSNQPAPEGEGTAPQPEGVFNKGEGESPQQSAPQVPEELKELIGEGKKYKTVDDALRSVPHAQQHISTLEQQMEDLNKEVARRRAAEEILEEVRNQRGQEQPAATTPDASPASEKDVEQLVESMLDRRLTAREQEASVKQNQQSVVSGLTEKYGEKAEEVYTQKAEELGVPVSFLDDIAAKSPQAVLAYFSGSSKSGPTRTSPGLNTEQVAQNHSQQTQRKPIMHGASSEDVLSAWRRAAPQE